MKCPTCGHEMALGKDQALCPNCGATAPLPAGGGSVAATGPAPASSEPAPVEPTPAASGAAVGMPRPPRRWRGVWIAVVSVLAVLVAASGVAAYYAYMQQPNTALADYLVRLGKAKTATYNGTMTYQSTSGQPAFGLDRLSLTFDGRYDLKDKKNPKTAGVLSGFMGQYGLKVELRELDKTLYGKLEAVDLLKSFGLNVPQEWYKVDLKEQLDSSECAQKASGAVSVWGTELPKELPLKNVRLVAPLETVAGHRALHFAGELDKGRLQAFIDKANKDLPADCRLTYEARDFEGVEVAYDLWSGWNFDRIRVVANDTKDKARVELVADTLGYDQPVKIEAPSGAKDLQELIQAAAADWADEQQEGAVQGATKKAPAPARR